MTRRTLTAAVTALLLAACGGSEAPETAEAASAVAQSPASEAATLTDAQLAALPPVVVYKSEFCGCCNGWVDHLREAGFEVEARNVQDLNSVKLDAGVPTDLASCHTALIEGYVVEGHVPAHVVEKLLAERPEVAGIATPGMPVGSPGMEGPNAQPYEVMAFQPDGSRTTYAEVDPR